MLFSVFFFKQKTAYEVRISDWSSDVCSSDLATAAEAVSAVAAGGSSTRFLAGGTTIYDLMKLNVETPTRLVDVTAIRELSGFDTSGSREQIGRASCRERVCQYV